MRKNWNVLKHLFKFSFKLFQGSKMYWCQFYKRTHKFSWHSKNIQMINEKILVTHLAKELKNKVIREYTTHCSSPSYHELMGPILPRKWKLIMTKSFNLDFSKSSLKESALEDLQPGYSNTTSSVFRKWSIEKGFSLWRASDLGHGEKESPVPKLLLTAENGLLKFRS